jgi:hypothetical protein
MLTLPYQAFFRQEAVCLDQLKRFLGVGFDRRLRSAWAEQSDRHGDRQGSKPALTADERADIAERKDAEFERWTEDDIESEHGCGDRAQPVALCTAVEEVGR